MSALTLQTMSEHDATKLTEKIRITAHNYADARQKLQGYVAEAKAGNAHLALGYASWTAYLAEVLGEEPMRLARGERQEMVQMLSAEGMSTRAIAPIVGANHNTVARDIAGVSNETPDTVQGMDGKTYARPEPQPEPVRDVARDLDVINDIRLYFNAIASSRQVAGLTPKGKQHIIDAATNLITQLQKDQ